ncbi:purine-nucleoside phosphorylase [Rubrivivax gelatinosus]|uniref:purine-nucleoside phosphorylase n=1 Tax=Rubrivivax gelatinosus TaxID=28068 RepID=UPI001908A9AA|nr:purine-nucleoside phosphorylase [Rubrivivax gelatinosus]MBK1612900.1 purine-nucleoside phosphorylase [Rubrivivax gelatinosus]
MNNLDSAIEASVRRLAALGPAPEVAVVLGSGWDGIAELVENPVDLPYAELPAFPRLAVAGHAGVLRAGTVGDRPVWLLRGRKHAYEDGDPAGMKGAIRTLAAAGCRTLVLTNAAGSLDAAMPPGSLMLIADHLNVVQRTPLHGEPGNDRFVDMGRAYDPALREQAHAAAAAAGIALPEGVYAWVLGPQFETPAEIRMLALLGAQAVGMSTVPETILARHAGLAVLGLSMFTNMAAGLSAETLSHEHTMAVARGGAADAARLLAALLPRLGRAG